MRQTLLWTAAALLGIVATALVAWSASQLTGQRIGLGSEPLSAVTQLAPRMSTPAEARRPVRQRAIRPKRPTLPQTRSKTTSTASPAPAGSTPAAATATPTQPATPAPSSTPAPAPTSTSTPPPAAKPAAPREDNSGSSSSNSSSGAQRDD